MQVRLQPMAIMVGCGAQRRYSVRLLPSPKANEGKRLAAATVGT